jgi:hypothetical protein
MVSNTLRAVYWWRSVLTTKEPSGACSMSFICSRNVTRKPVLDTTLFQNSSRRSFWTSPNLTLPIRASCTGAVMAILLRG